MSAVEINKWLATELDDRQKFVDKFYTQANPEQWHHLLGLVKAPRGYGVYASIGPNYQYAIFGRDCIKVAGDLMDYEPTLVKEVILLLARLQGEEFNIHSEEEPGKIHHEYRAVHFNGHQVPQAALTVFRRMAPIWGGDGDELLYYGSFDATPLYIRLVQRYCQRYGTDILDEIIVSRSGAKKPLRAHVRMAVQWVVDKLTASPWQLYEFKRINPAGLYNQSWEDSSVSYLHTDGAVANADDGIAAIELQGYVYDALRSAAQIVAADEEEGDSWRHLASIVRDTTLERLWMDKQKFFAMGLDRADSGETRQIATLSSNAGLLLGTDLLTLMPHHLSWPYIEGVVRTLFSEDFITPAGLRVRALRHAGLVTFADYHGSLVSWPRQTYAVAEGLRYHGFYKLATVLENCIIDSVKQAGEFYEFFFVDSKNRVKYHYRIENPDEPSFHDFGAANLPDPGQAWTLSAVMAIVGARHNPGPLLPVIDSVRKLEKEILAQPHIKAVIKKTT